MQTQNQRMEEIRGGCLRRVFPLLLGMSTARLAVDSPWFEITRHQFRFARHSEAFHGYRIVHITDIHADDEFMIPERLASFVQKVNRLKADVVLITGDFASIYKPIYAQTLAGLAELQARDGVFGVLGNHDHYSGAEWVRECLRAARVQELNDATYTIQRGEEMLHLVGLDDLWPTNNGEPAPLETHLPRLARLVDSLPREGTAVLLVHEPDIADVAASTGRIDLQLSGHSHGGQVRIPLYGLLTSILPPLARRYPRGLYQVEGMKLYTNRGIGSPLRFNNTPEVAVIDLYHMD